MKGMCIKSFCRDRHQRTCRYWKRGICYRCESCEFSHIELKRCHKCWKAEVNLYYCDFCGNDFCSNCTIQQAYEENYKKITDILGCDQIMRNRHNNLEDEIIDDDDDEHDDLESRNVDQKCQCEIK